MQSFKLTAVLILFIILATGCTGSSDPGEDDDTVAPAVTLTSPLVNEQVSGQFTVRWQTNERNRSTVDIEISSNSGASWTTLAARVTDAGSYIWDSTATPDGNYQLRIIARDITGNESAPASTLGDFEVNNDPEIAGATRYVDSNNNAVVDAGDLVVVPFDLPVNINSASSEDFTLPVLANSFGTGASIIKGPGGNEVSITLGEGPKLRPQRLFNSGQRGNPDAPSGIGFSPIVTTGIAAAGSDITASAFDPVDLAPGFHIIESGIWLGGARHYDIADMNGDGFSDIVSATNANVVIMLNDGTGAFVGAQRLNIPADWIKPINVDNDSDIDLVVHSGSQLSIYENQGSGNFVLLPGSVTSGFSGHIPNGQWDIAIADVDNSNGLDVLFVWDNGGASNISGVWLNNGNNTFPMSRSYSLPPASRIKAGHLDGDNLVDIVTVRYPGENIASVLINNGSGFTAGQQLSPGTFSEFILHDIDSDGELDLAFSNSGPVFIYSGTGAGTFEPSDRFINTAFASTIAAGDVNGDGIQDFLLGGGEKVVSNVTGETVYVGDQVWLGTTTPDYVEQRRFFDQRSTKQVVLADLNNDGNSDLVRLALHGADSNDGYFFPGAVNVYLGEGGAFTQMQQPNGANPATGMAVGRVGPNGTVKMVAVANGGSGVTLFHRRGPIEDVQTRDASGTKDVLFADLNRDGRLDMVGGGDAIRIWLQYTTPPITGVYFPGTANQSFGSQPGPYRAMAITDINRDGDLDFLILGSAGVQQFRNNGAGTMSIWGGGISAPVDGRAVSAGDIDKDGDIDFVVAGNAIGNGSVRVFRNTNGAGNYIDTLQAIGNGNATAVAMGDIDNDGDQDLVVGYEARATEVWINDGTGMYLESRRMPQRLLELSATTSIVLADLDKDGWLDVVEGNGIPQQTYPSLVGGVDAYRARSRVWLNNGRGLFTEHGQALPSGIKALALIDYDYDSDTDITMLTAQGMEVWANDASTFWPSVTLADRAYLRGLNIVTFAHGDLDNDGDTDVVLAESGQLSVLINNGYGGFIRLAPFAISANNNTDVELGDFDQDGDLDIVEVNNGQQNRVWRNNGNNSFSLWWTEPSNSSTVDVEVVDVNRDGWPDLVFGNNAANLNAVYRNTRTVSGFSAYSTFGTSTNHLKSGDFDNDGDIDIIESTYSNTYVWSNNGFGSFSLSQTAAFGPVDGVADFDQDGDLDIYSVNSDTLTLARNDGSGTFSTTGGGGAAIQYLPGGALYSGLNRMGLIADYNSDGRPDYLSLLSDGYPTLWLGAAGVFSPSSNRHYLSSGEQMGFRYRNYFERTKAFDFDKDGDLDVIEIDSFGELSFVFNE